MATARIWVGIRPRPLEPGATQAFDFDPVQNTLSGVGDAYRTSYSFDRVFDFRSDGREIYEASTKKVVNGVLAGINGTVFAYGQTGSGKTFTMSALTRMAVDEIFEKVRADPAAQYKLRMSIIELYCERVKDLLRDDKTPLDLRLDAVRGWIVDGVTEAPIESVEQFELLLRNGEERRATGATAMNQRSSRSHLILSLWVECVQPGEAGEEPASRLACLNLVDLAGSEGQKTAQTTGQRLIEGKDINLSLLALSKMLRDCSEAPGVNKPYRDSKLTMLLRSAIGGNCWTAMLGCVAPSSEHKEQCMQTLEFASRAKMVSNKVTINVLDDPLTALTKDNLRLKRRIEGLQIKNDSLTARLKRIDTVGKSVMGGPTPCKETPRGTPLRHSHGGTPFGGVWSAAQFMASVRRPDFTHRKDLLYTAKKRAYCGEGEDEEGEIVVPATPCAAKPLLPLFRLDDDSPPKEGAECKLVGAQSRPKELTDKTSVEAQPVSSALSPVPSLCSMVPEASLLEAQCRVEDLRKENAALKMQVQDALHRETTLIAEKQALAASVILCEEARQQLQQKNSQLQQSNSQLAKELEETRQAQSEAVTAAAVKAVQAAAEALQKDESKQPYRDREREMAIEWRQERLKLKEKHLNDIMEMQRKHDEEIKATAKQAREQAKLHRAALADMATKEKGLVVALGTAQKALQIKVDENVALGSVKRRVAPLRATLTDVTNTIAKRRIEHDPKVARGLSFVSTTKKSKFQLEYKIEKKACKRLRLEGEVDPEMDEIQEFLIREVKKKNKAIKTRKLAMLMNEVERNLWKNHKFGTEFSKGMMPADEQDLIVESIIWVDLVEEDAAAPKVIMRARFKEWWNGEYIGHMPDKERDAYVETLDEDLGMDVMLEKFFAPDLLQFFLKNMVTRQQWQVACETGEKDAQRREDAKRNKSKGGIAKAQAELESEMRIVGSPVY